MANVVLARSFDPPATEEGFAELRGCLSPCLDRSGAGWTRSHPSRDRRRGSARSDESS